MKHLERDPDAERGFVTPGLTAGGGLKQPNRWCLPGRPLSPPASPPGAD